MTIRVAQCEFHRAGVRSRLGSSSSFGTRVRAFKRRVEIIHAEEQHAQPGWSETESGAMRNVPGFHCVHPG